ncbi:MAG: hypothetical protein SPJ34_05825 [Candidatus Ornithospirochaeta sp.]|nr:hypothetical protein [Candidatus Ornithospirochaeta sp.]
MKKLIISLMLALSVFSSFAQAETESISPSYVAQNADPKYIFMFIGDGMSAPQINAAQIFNGTNVPGNIDVHVPKRCSALLLQWPLRLLDPLSPLC